KHTNEDYTLSLHDALPIYSGNMQEAIESRKKQHEANGKLKTPRVMTSDGEIIEGKPRTGSGLKDALMGTPVSSGSVTGIARVIRSEEHTSELQSRENLVCR